MVWYTDGCGSVIANLTKDRVRTPPPDYDLENINAQNVSEEEPLQDRCIFQSVCQFAIWLGAFGLGAVW